MYAITATIRRERREGNVGWWKTTQIPTFYLDENVQGFTDSRGAERIARDILDPFGLGMNVRVTAVKL